MKIRAMKACCRPVQAKSLNHSFDDCQSSNSGTSPATSAYPGYAWTYPTYPPRSRPCSCSCLVKIVALFVIRPQQMLILRVHPFNSINIGDRYGAQRSVCMAIFATFFQAFNVPVFWSVFTIFCVVFKTISFLWPSPANWAKDCIIKTSTVQR